MPVYTLDELLKEMEPQGRKDQALAIKCIDGLTQYAAELRQRGGPEGQAKIPDLRKLVGYMADYWALGTAPGGLDGADCQEKFDRRIEEAGAAATPWYPSPGQKSDVVLGLYRYATDLIPNLGSEAKDEIIGCKALIREVEAFWDFGSPLLDQLCDDIDTELQEQISRENKLEMGGIQ